MKFIKIIDAPVYETSSDKIRRHLGAALMRIRLNRLVTDPENDFEMPVDFDGETFEDLDEDLIDEIEPDRGDEMRIRERAEKLCKARIAATGLSHLKMEDLDRLTPALNGVQIVMARDLDWADQIAADLHEEMPWMAGATEHLWRALSRSARLGAPITLRPFILNGPPGIGKSVWARSVATALSLPTVDIDASKGGAGMAIAGLERGWGSALSGRPIDLILSTRIANPLIVVDEICKARSVTSTRGTQFAFADALLSLLEPATATSWECPYYRVKINTSHISWVLTSNEIANVSEPVRSRCQVIEIPDVTTEQLQGFAHRKGRKMGLSDVSIEAAAMAIAQAPSITRRRQSLRDVVRMLERAEDMEGRPRLQ